HGTDQLAVEDVRGIGKAISVTLGGDDVNMFTVLSRGGNVKNGNSGQGKGAQKEKRC
ncbi:hypothetical protein L195_g063497, partial [Trifolium pratense]